VSRANFQLRVCSHSLSLSAVSRRDPSHCGVVVCFCIWKQKEEEEEVEEEMRCTTIIIMA
jgi:hypothetical protein